MSIGSHYPKLAHAPRFIAKWLAYFRAGSAHEGVQRVDVLYLQIGEVRVVTELARWDGIAALSRHDGAASRGVKQPTRIRNSVDVETEHITVKRCGYLQVRHRDHEGSFGDGKHCIPQISQSSALATRALMILLINSIGKGLSSGNWIVPFEVL